jgi:hypothetical protein
MPTSAGVDAHLVAELNLRRLQYQLHVPAEVSIHRKDTLHTICFIPFSCGTKHSGLSPGIKLTQFLIHLNTTIKLCSFIDSKSKIANTHFKMSSRSFLLPNQRRNINPIRQVRRRTPVADPGSGKNRQHTRRQLTWH